MVRLPLILLGCFVLSPLHAEEKTVDPAAAEFFEKKIRPVLTQHCFECHSAESKKLKGHLRLDSREGMIAGGDLGAAIVPGNPQKSRLIEALTYKNLDLQMPPNGKLPASVVDDFSTWIKNGATWVGTGAAGGLVVEKFDLAKRKAEHWSWRPIATTEALPAVKDGKWPRSPVDRFILAKLEAKELQPASTSDPRTLIRRIYFDIIGLPPKPADVDVFVREYADQPDAALAKVVDKLLASPQFGERWARHWLDLVRYGESRGHEFDPNIPNAYHYRDYVIRALNDDVPYNQFVMEHIAGDLLEKPRRHAKDGFNESILGTGFWFLGEEVHSPVDIRGDEADRFDNRIDVFSKTFLGLTLSCARCHDHKFDAISTKDYYALFGFLRSSNYRLARFDSIETNKEIAAKLTQLRDSSRSKVQQGLAQSMRPRVDRLADYLLASRDAMLLELQKREQLAKERKLDPLVLEGWLAYLQKALKNPGDPFYPWTTLSKNWDEVNRLKDSLKNPAGMDNILKNAEVVVDYSMSSPADWMPDDVSFGPHAARAGEPRFGTDANHPIVSFTETGAAMRDPIWNRQKLAPGTELEHGSLGGVARAGNTIRTPTFELKTGRVFYWVKGAGKIYAAVDSHTLINGPLHGQLFSGFNTNGKWQWVGLDLTPYKDHRIHLEYTAASDAEFALGMVVQSNGPPASLERKNELVAALCNAGSVKALAESYQKLFEQVLTALETDKLIGSDKAHDTAKLANWLLQHQELVVQDSKSLATSSDSFIAEQTRLIGQIKLESRLAAAMQDGSPENEHVFIRGSHKAPGEVVPRRFLEALAGKDELKTPSGSGRLELARQMTDPKINPFVTRVMVNRIWHHLFGRGIVASTDNFGKMGEMPTHPELLDHLALTFAREGYSTKALIRELVLSSTYRMATAGDTKADAADPENLLLHKARLRRLEGEAIRDAMLSVSGRLNEKMYGPSVPLYLTSFLEGRGRPGSGPLDGDGRRSIYIAVRRNFLSPMMLAFDTPSPFSTVGRRTVSNVPAQALILMNDPFVHQQAELWGKKMAAMPGAPEARITTMYQMALARPARQEEISRATAFLESETKSTGKTLNDPAVWGDLAHVLFNVKEFIYLP
jgi:hypothetical protein